MLDEAGRAAAEAGRTMAGAAHAAADALKNGGGHHPSARYCTDFVLLVSVTIPVLLYAVLAGVAHALAGPENW